MFQIDIGKLIASQGDDVVRGVLHYVGPTVAKPVINDVLSRMNASERLALADRMERSAEQIRQGHFGEAAETLAEQVGHIKLF